MPLSGWRNKLESSSLHSHRMMFQGNDIPASFGSVEEEYWAIHQAAGYCELSYRARIFVAGDDAPRFLHGMVTSDVVGMAVGSGSNTFFLNVQGHILAQAKIFRLADTQFLLDAEPQSHNLIVDLLNRHIIMDVVEVEDAREKLSCVAIEGPRSGDILEGAIRSIDGGDSVQSLQKLTPLNVMRVAQIDGWMIRVSYTGRDGYWIMAPRERVDTWMAWFQSHGDARPVGYEALEACRIEAGVPRYGADITEKNLLQETGQMDAVSFNKGCYIGQEVVERVRSRGHVNRSLMRLLIEGRHEISPESPIHREDQVVGYTGSGAYSFAEKKTIVFGYLRREFAIVGTQVMCAGVPAIIQELPEILKKES